MGWEAIIGANVRRVRKARGLSQEALAAEVAIDMRQLGRIERGESFPSMGTFFKIAEALGTPPVNLLSATDQPS